MRWNGTRDLQKNQEKRLIDESPKPLKSVVKFALVTVLRKSNIINLEWQQIDMQRQVARVSQASHYQCFRKWADGSPEKWFVDMLTLRLII